MSIPCRFRLRTGWLEALGKNPLLLARGFFPVSCDGGELVGRNRRGEVVALSPIATELEEPGLLAGMADALGDRAQPQRAPDLEDGLHEHRLFRSPSARDDGVD